MPITPRRWRTIRRRIRTVTILVVAAASPWMVNLAVRDNHHHRVKTVTPEVVAAQLSPGLERPPDPTTTSSTTEPTTTMSSMPVAVTTTVYHPPVTPAVRAASGSPAPATTTTTRAVTTTTSTRPVSTTARVVPPVTAAVIGSCGPYPFTVCIPPVGSPSTWSCILSRESSGNPQATGRQGEIGLFQIAPWTLSGLGYTEAQMRSSISIQIQAATKLYLARGFQPWTPSDGCR